MKNSLRIGTRGSPLALVQAEETKNKLLTTNPGLAGEVEIEIVPIRTSGDWNPQQREQSFRDLGSNKELFTKEIDEALLTGHVDIAVHSMKDVSTWLPENMEIMAVLERADPREAFIGRNVKKFEDLPSGAAIGTCSVRRQAQILASRPDLRVVSLRGNVETRLKKLADNQADATLLALAGLQRLGLHNQVSSIISTDLMLPAAAQGAIGIAARTDDAEMRALLQTINIRESFLCIAAERAFLNRLDGSCHTPIGALAMCDASGQIQMEGLIAKPDGTLVVRMKASGAAETAEKIGDELGIRVKSALPPDFCTA
jgi:hydroxymethylbilane synthase